MAEAASNYWQMGTNIFGNLAQSGVFGSTVQKYTGVINQPNPIAAPNPAPTPPPVAGQMGVNPAPASSDLMDHLKANWGKYALGGGALLLLVVGVFAARR